MSTKKLLLIDSYALIYRSYYAFINRPMYSPKGFNTSVIYGFLVTLEEILRKALPTHIGAAFDVSGETFRHKLYAEYKVNREETPQDIIDSVPVIKQILEYLKIPILQQEGFEADDIIGTLAYKAVNRNFEVLIVTPDKDYAQLVNDKIKIYRPKKAGNNAEILDIETIRNEFNVTQPSQVIDILALMGDSADNVPGVKGIGEVTAKKLIGQYQSVENLIQHVSELKPAIRTTIESSLDTLMLCKKLVTIETNVPIEFIESAYIRQQPDEIQLKRVLEELNFKSLIPKLLTNNAQQQNSKSTTVVQLNIFDTLESKQTDAPVFSTTNNTPHQYYLVDNHEKLEQLLQKLEQSSEFCFDTETSGLQPHTDLLTGISFCVKPFEAFYLPVPSDLHQATEILAKFRSIFMDREKIKIGHNLKFDILFLNRYGLQVEGLKFDTMLAHYLIQPEQSHKLDNLARKYLNYSPIPIENLIGKKGAGQLNMQQVPLAEICEYACEDADITLRLKCIIEKELEAAGLKPLFYDLEIKLLDVLIDIEQNGFSIDIEYLQAYQNVLKTEISKIESEIYHLAGEVFNISSPRQLGEILFNKLKIPYQGKKTKTQQYSTNEEILQQLTDKHPIVEKILEYRGLTKLLSTYVEALPKLINPNTHKIHTSFNQTLTVTGRLSSNNPNLQNIPIRDEQGREIRKAFIPSKGNILLSADYSQIELRIMAHMSNDSNLIEAFLQDEDIHAATASKIFKIPLKEVTRDQRSKAKMANFGIIYGISAFGLAQRMNIPRKEASELITEYFKTFPGIQQYMNQTIQFAREHGYVETLLKRRRFLSDIQSQNAIVRGMAERNAINSPIQGSAADIIKLAMVRIFEKFREMQLCSKMILQVHDELIFDVVLNELEVVKHVVKHEMEHAYPLVVPLKVDMGTGNNWLEAH